jgi:hypothetical protein
MKINIQQIIEKGNKISCELCNSKDFNMFSARVDDEGNINPEISEYFDRPVVVTVCINCDDSHVEIGEKIL